MRSKSTLQDGRLSEKFVLEPGSQSCSAETVHANGLCHIAIRPRIHVNTTANIDRQVSRPAVSRLWDSWEKNWSISFYIPKQRKMVRYLGWIDGEVDRRVKSGSWQRLEKKRLY